MKYIVYIDMRRMHGAVVILSLVPEPKVPILQLC
jgi:hypothetical protein